MYHYKERNNNFSLKNYEKMIDFLVPKFPWSIPHILEKNILNQKNDEITPVLKSFVLKYKPYLFDYLNNHPIENNLTRLCLVSLNKHCLEFGGFLREQYPEIHMNEEYFSFYLLYFHKNHTLQWILNNPQFYALTTNNFTTMYDRLFHNSLQTISKEHYDFFFLVTKKQLHTTTIEEYLSAIYSNLTPFVKKYYKQFKDHDFDFTFFHNNTCTKFINKQKKEASYKDLLHKLPAKNIHTKKLKI